MSQNIMKLMYTDNGKLIISLILGIGLASIFRKVCDNRSCLIFHAPPMDKLSNQVYKHGESCYKFKEESVECNKNKKQIYFA